MEDPNVKFESWCEHIDFARLPDRLVVLLKGEHERKDSLIMGQFFVEKDEEGVERLGPALIGVPNAGLHLVLDKQQASYLVQFLAAAFPVGEGAEEGQVEQARQVAEPAVTPDAPPPGEGWAPPGWTQPRIPGIDPPPWHPDR